MIMLLDSNAFDFFYNRGMHPYDDLIAAKFIPCAIPEVRIEILERNKPKEIKKIYIDLEEKEKIKLYPIFGFTTYQNIQKNSTPVGITGYSSYKYNSSEMGACLTYKKIIFDKNHKKEKREAYLHKRSPKAKKSIDRILSAHAVNSIVLSCDAGDALGAAYDYGHQVVFLGNANPAQPRPKNRPCFDDFDGDLVNYINTKLAEQRLKYIENTQH